MRVEQNAGHRDLFDAPKYMTRFDSMSPQQVLGLRGLGALINVLSHFADLGLPILSKMQWGYGQIGLELQYMLTGFSVSAACMECDRSLQSTARILSCHYARLLM